MLGEARYWCVARSPKEIKRDMVWKLNELPLATQESLLGFWRFDVGSGCYIEDLSKQLTATFVYMRSGQRTHSLWKKTAIVGGLHNPMIKY